MFALTDPVSHVVSSPHATLPDPLAAELPADMLESMTEVIPLDALPEYGGRILAGQTRGRVVVEMG